MSGAARGRGRAHALRMASEGAAVVGMDLAGPRPGVPVRVDSVHPGGVNTPMGSGDMVGALMRAAETNPKPMQTGT